MMGWSFIGNNFWENFFILEIVFSWKNIESRFIFYPNKNFNKEYFFKIYYFQNETNTFET